MPPCSIFTVGLYAPCSIFTVGLYATLILLGTSINASVPLYYEVCIEAVYPVSESLATGIIMICYNLFPVLFLLVGLVPNLGK